jgi:hypothetical protein
MYPRQLSYHVLSVSFAIIVASATYADACGSGKVILQDKFEMLDPAWGFDPESTIRSNGPDGLTYKLGPLIRRSSPRSSPDGFSAVPQPGGRGSGSPASP